MCAQDAITGSTALTDSLLYNTIIQDKDSVSIEPTQGRQKCTQLCETPATAPQFVMLEVNNGSEEMITSKL